MEATAQPTLIPVPVQANADVTATPKAEDLGITGSIMILAGATFELMGYGLTSKPILSGLKMFIIGYETLESALTLNLLGTETIGTGTAIVTTAAKVWTTVLQNLPLLGMLIAALVAGVLIRKLGSTMKNPDNIRWIKTTLHLA